MMQVLILEDEIPSRNRLKTILEAFDDVQVTGECDSVESAVNWIRKNGKPDAAFFDIQLSDGLSFELFDYIDNSFPVIFTTAYEQYALEAFRANGLDYLLKPITVQSVRNSLEKLEQFGHSWASLREEAMGGISGDHNEAYRSRFLVRTGDQLTSLSTTDIALVYSFEKSSYAVTSRDRKYLIDLPMEKVQSGLNPNIFFRINRQHIVAYENIRQIYIHSNSRLKVELIHSGEETEFIVSRERVKEFKNWLDR